MQLSVNNARLGPHCGSVVRSIEPSPIRACRVNCCAGPRLASVVQRSPLANVQPQRTTYFTGEGVCSCRSAGCRAVPSSRMSKMLLFAMALQQRKRDGKEDKRSKLPKNLRLWPSSDSYEDLQTRCHDLLPLSVHSVHCHRFHVQMRRVIDTIRGRSYEEALVLLEYLPYRATEPILKTLLSVNSIRSLCTMMNMCASVVGGGKC